MDHKIITIDEVLEEYNHSNEECVDDDGYMLKFGVYSIEEFQWWLNNYNYVFIKLDD